MNWTVDLPGWHGQSDPEIKGETIWVHTDYDGEADIAIVSAARESGEGRVSVIRNPVITSEVDGECLGTLPGWDSALEFALSALEY